MGFQLRPYQIDLNTRVFDAWGCNPLAHIFLQSPTGAGKTEMGQSAIEELLTRSNCVVWLTHRAELRRQLSGRMQRHEIPLYDLVNDVPDSRYLHAGAVNVISPFIRGASGIYRSATPADLLVVDEAHHLPAATWAAIVRNWPGPVLGLSATPWRLDPTQGFREWFDTLIYGGSTMDLVREGYLTPPRVMTPARVSDRIHGDDANLTGGDYTADAVDTRVLSTTRIIDLWHEAVAGKDDTPTVWFVQTLKAAQALHDTLRAANIRAPILHANVGKEERARVMRAYAQGYEQHIINVDIVGEGVDLPRIGCVVLARPTLSLTWWLQAAGRTLRLEDGKLEAVIFDAAASVLKEKNRREWSYREDIRADWTPFEIDKWTLDARAIPLDGEAPTAPCPACLAELHPMLRICPYCGKYQFGLCLSCSRDQRLDRLTAEGCCEVCIGVEQPLTLRTLTRAA